MKRFIKIAFLRLPAVFLFSPGFPAPGHTQIPEGNETPEETRIEKVRNFKEWRDSIPDLEKHLYDRVKGINKRVIRVQNLVIGSFLLFLLFNGVFLVAIYRWVQDRKNRALAGKPAQRPLAAPELIRFNLDRIVMVFDRAASATVRFRFTPLPPPGHQRLRSLKIRDFDKYKGVRLMGGYAK